MKSSKELSIELINNSTEPTGIIDGVGGHPLVIFNNSKVPERAFIESMLEQNLTAVSLMSTNETVGIGEMYQPVFGKLIWLSNVCYDDVAIDVEGEKSIPIPTICSIQYKGFVEFLYEGLEPSVDTHTILSNGSGRVICRQYGHNSSHHKVISVNREAKTVMVLL